MKLYGVAEIAKELKVKPNTVSVWLARGHLPMPTADLACGPVWSGGDIGSFIRREKKAMEALKPKPKSNGTKPKKTKKSRSKSAAATI